MTHLTRRNALKGGAALGGLALTGAGLGGLASCGGGGAGNSAELTTVLDGMVTDILKRSPEQATSLAASEQLAGGPFMARVSDRSLAGLAADNALVTGWIEKLEAIKPDGLSPADVISRDVALSAAKYSQAGHRFGYGDSGFGPPQPYVVSQLSGSYVGMPDFLDSQHPVENQAGADAWLARMEGFAGQISAETGRVVEDAAKGVIAPNFIIDRALGQLRGMAGLPAAESVLVTGLTRKATEAGLDAGKLGQSATTLVNDKVVPALRAQIEALEGLRARATSDAGVWKLPEGDAYYGAGLGYWTTTGRSADDVFTLGETVLAEVQAEMDTGLKALGLTTGTVGERMQALARDPQYLYPNTDDGKAALIGDLNVQMEALARRLPEVFGQLPRAPVEVKRIPPATEAGAPGGYYQPPAPDGSRPGAYYINLRDTAEWPKWSLPTLTYHEASPGHHLQIALAQEAEGLHYLRSKLLWFGANGEGWALYAEQLADEIGMFASDQPGRLGYLQSMAFRASRCVVDTGLHAKRWTKDRAVNFMVDATGDKRESVVTEIERYCVWPGQATCYMVGKVDILEAREKAKAALGEKFALPSFHDQVLLEGAMPLDVLNRSLDAWVAGQKA
jgi:uncharacterized protein (DUF885 family)